MTHGVDIVEIAEGLLDDEVRCGALPRPPEISRIGEAVEGLNAALYGVYTIGEGMRKPDAGEFDQALAMKLRVSSLLGPLSVAAPARSRLLARHRLI